MALIKCPKCRAQIPSNSKFCPECGCNILEGLQIKERQHEAAEKYTPTHKNGISDNADVPMPKFSNIIVLGIALIFATITLFFGVQISMIFAILSIILFIVILCGWISSIKNYSLAKKDFAEYREKVLKEQKETKERQDAYNAQREQERKREAEKEAALSARRAEYSAKGLPSCPKCGSPAIATVNRGYSLVWGFIGSGKPVNVCQKCGYKWKI